jgi:hypothetical protein
MGFCRDIFLNSSFDYFLTIKSNNNFCNEIISFENIWRTICSYNHCRDINQNPFSLINHKNFIEFKNLNCINSMRNNSFTHYPIPSFINKNNFVQGIKIGNSNCYKFLVEFKDVFCVIQCIGS